jgi:CPA2 family monovalent cation:H+ antiporter-2
VAAEHQFVLDLAVALGASALSGCVAVRLRQPALLGYLAAGLLIGPSGFRLLNDVHFSASSCPCLRRRWC